jgi:hypothetical protein
MYVNVCICIQQSDAARSKEVVNNCVGSAMQPYVQGGKVSGVMEEARIRIRTS